MLTSSVSGGETCLLKRGRGVRQDKTTCTCGSPNNQPLTKETDPTPTPSCSHAVAYNETDCPPLWFPEEQPCSGRGSCVFGDCSCPADWAGAPDMSVGRSCAINVTAVTALWAIAAILQIGLAGYSVFYLWRKKPGKTFAELTRASILVGVFSFIYAVCMATVAIIRATHVTTIAVGSDVTLTVLFAIGSSAFYISGVISASIRFSR